MIFFSNHIKKKSKALLFLLGFFKEFSLFFSQKTKQINKMLRNEKLETRLNGEHPFFYSYNSKDPTLQDSINIDDEDEIIELENKDYPVSNRIQPRKQPGLYMVRCLINDMRYYGESKNVNGRLASHRSYLRRGIHPCVQLQHDWKTYSEENFDFVVLFMGSEWVNLNDRRAKETLLIVQDRNLSYNYLEDITKKPKELNPFWGRKHSEKNKKLIGDSMRHIRKNALGKAIKLDGVIYPSLAQASRDTGHARKTIRKRINDPNDPNCIEL